MTFHQSTVLARRRFAFSLLELLLVVTIIGIMAAIIVPRIGGHTGRAKINVCHQFKADLNSAIERYYFDNHATPNGVEDLYPDYYAEEIPVCPVTGDAYTVDQTVGRVVGHEHD